MRSSWGVLILVALVFSFGIATAFPVPLIATLRPARAWTSPRVSCTEFDGRIICKKFALPINHRKSTTSSSHDQFFSTIIGPGQLMLEEDRQIRRIMDVKEQRTRDGERKLWSIPDVQVVLWFILLCCVTEGLVVGFRWWRGDDSLASERQPLLEKKERVKPRRAEEKDEDDEVNIPVL